MEDCFTAILILDTPPYTRDRTTDANVDPNISCSQSWGDWPTGSQPDTGTIGASGKWELN